MFQKRERMIDRKTFLIVGFGGMGCRHAQSLIDANSDSLVYIFEPNDKIYESNLDLIGQSMNNKVHRLSNFDQINFKIDFCVVATSSEPRFEILMELLDYEIPHFLVEKVVFQSDSQFKNLKKSLGREKIFVNFVNRYFETYIDIKKGIRKRPFSIDVIGGDFGLGCNALHYFDLFKYFGGKDPVLSNFSLSEDSRGNKRGSSYKEFEGQISIEDKQGSTLNISSDLGRLGDVEILIKYSDRTHFINEGLLKEIRYFRNKIITKPLTIHYTSKLTAKIYRDICESNCLLPTISNTEDIHQILFESINKSLNVKLNEKCPIT